MQAGSHPAENDRNLTAALVVAPGIVTLGDLLVSALATPNMSVNVAIGAAFILGSESTLQGMYHVFNDAITNLAIAASNATNPRNDLIVAQVRDAFYSGASNDFRLVVVTGTPAASPVDPALPADSIVLARVLVSAAVTTIVAGKITDLRVASSIKTAPRGTLGYAQVTASVGPFTAEATIIGTVSATVAAGRRIRITAEVPSSTPNTGGDVWQLRIYEYGGSQLNYKNGAPVATGDTQGYSVMVVLTPSAGTHSYYATMLRATGSGSNTAIASATAPIFMLVEDIGA